MNNYAIKIPEKFYCGFQQRSDDELLGFLTPFGTDSAFQKRKYTVDSWAKQNRNKPPLEPKIFDNELLEGFRLDRHIKRYGWNGGNVVVRVEDPRGFEAEISVANLCKLIENNIIEAGLIKAKCIWGRDGARNVLLAENSEPYLVAIRNTERGKKSIPVKDIRPGNEIQLKNGKTGIYMGPVFLLDLIENHTRSELHFCKENNPRRKYAMLETDQRNNSHVVVYSELKASQILSADINWEEETRREFIHSLQYKPMTEISFPWNVSGFAFDADHVPVLKLIHFDPAKNGTALRQSIGGKIILKNRQTGRLSWVEPYRIQRALEFKDIGDIRGLAGFIEFAEPNVIVRCGKLATRNRFYSVFEQETDDTMKRLSSVDELFAKYEIFTLHYSLKGTSSYD